MTTIDLDRIDALVYGRIRPDTDTEAMLVFELKRIRELRDVEALIAERDRLHDEAKKLRAQLPKFAQLPTFTAWSAEHHRLIAENAQLTAATQRVAGLTAELHIQLRRGEQPPLAAVLSRLEEALNPLPEVGG